MGSQLLEWGRLLIKNTLEVGRLFERRALAGKYQQQNGLYLFTSNYEILASRDGAAVRVLATNVTRVRFSDLA